MPMRLLMFSLTLVLCACGGGSGSDTAPFGLVTRSAAVLNFSGEVPQMGDVQLDFAFPLLSFSSPAFLTTAAGDDTRLYVLELGGKVKAFVPDANTSAAVDFLDLSDRTQFTCEEGLLGLAFDPDYTTNGFVYAYYIANAGTAARTSVVARYSTDTRLPPASRVADRNSEVRLFTFPQPFCNHKGGWIGFGPDRKLYIALGDGGDANDPGNRAQNLSIPLGKMLRINTDGTAPADNPFVGVSGADARIWAYGLRNPFRDSFDRATGELWAGDVGQNTMEEVDIITRGGNYGWRVFEGTGRTPGIGDPDPGNIIQPVTAYGRSQGQTVTGGYVYRGSAIPKLFGSYVFGDEGSGRIWALSRSTDNSVTVNQIAFVTPNIVSFGEDQAGELYAVAIQGQILNLKSASDSGSGDFPQHLSDTGLFSDLATLTPAPGLIEYSIQAPFWSDGARKRRWGTVPAASRIGFAATGAWTWPRDSVLVKHFEITLADGSSKRLETRVLINQASGWQGYVYRWNDAGTDADLLSGGATVTLNTRAEDGTPRTQDYEFPSGSDCLRCHTGAAGYILGARTAQMNRSMVFPGGVSDNQLRAYNHIGLFDHDIGDAASYAVRTDPADTAANVSARARAYLDANCSQCHRPGGPTGVDMDLRAETANAAMNTQGVSPTSGDLGVSGAQRVKPGDKAGSVLWLRMQRLDSQRMPPLASHVVDQAGVNLIGSWIDAGAL